MAYVDSHPASLLGYGLYHTPLHSTTESLKRSIVVSEVELPLEDGVSAIPWTLPVSSQLDTLTLAPEQHKRKAIKTERTSKLDIHIGHHHLAQKDQSGLVPVQDQGQGVLALLASINDQTTSLLEAYSQSQSQSEDGDIGILEQALILGQIALVLASSLYQGASSSVGWPLDTSSQAQAPAKGQTLTLGVQDQVVVVALANMGVALVKQFDRTGDGRELEEAGGLYQQAMGMGLGMGDGVGGVDGTHGTDDVDGIDGVLGVLERLGALLDERGGRVWKGR